MLQVCEKRLPLTQTHTHTYVDTDMYLRETIGKITKSNGFRRQRQKHKPLSKFATANCIVQQQQEYNDKIEKKQRTHTQIKDTENKH